MAKAQFASNLPRIDTKTKNIHWQHNHGSEAHAYAMPLHVRMVPPACLFFFFLIVSSSKDHRSFTFPKKICFA